MTPEKYTDRMGAAEEIADAITQMSEMLTGQVRILEREGWTEQQARDLVVAVMMSNARGQVKA